MAYLVILRHGQSEFNLQNRFTGQLDIGLTENGRAEARAAGQKLLAKHFNFQGIFTSGLKRAQETLNIVLDEMHSTFDRNFIVRSNALNERHYGDLQGLNKLETASKYSSEQVMLWRRGYATRPPGGESLEDTFNRTVPFYKENIEPLLKKNKNVLIVAHGNSLRALMMYVEHISPTAVEHVEIATGVPKLYEFNDSLQVLSMISI
ncbi:MAG: 2,3-bisphosphoglycerate-dependent phosphoglycerate mutase [Chryseolinea sp.]